MSSTTNPKKKVLIIEDEGDLCLLLEMILSDSTTIISHAKTLQAAKDLLNEEKPDLVILDNRLPDGYGLDFLPYLRENYPATRVIMLSGKDVAAKDIALESGAHLFLSKPVAREKLKGSVSTLLS